MKLLHYYKKLFFVFLLIPYFSNGQCTFNEVDPPFNAVFYIGLCVTNTETYNVGILLNHSNAPLTGDLVAEDGEGNIYILASAPFTNNTDITYDIIGLPANGNAASLTAYFSDEPTCGVGTLNYTAPECICNFTYISVSISACDPNDNTFELSGILEFENHPTTGTLTVSDCNGNNQVFTAPFTSPLNYSITGIDSDGTTNCSITATFSDDPTCSVSSDDFDYPSTCLCEAEAGTYTAVVDGDAISSEPYLLCFGDYLDITALGDYTPPQDSSPILDDDGNPITYDPGLGLAVYDCSPSINAPDLINNDNCLLGIVMNSNDFWFILNSTGDGTTLYFRPITLYSVIDGIYAISINGGNWCYDFGPIYEVTYLPEITTTDVEDCQAGTITVTVSGGAPAFNGTNFTASNLITPNGTFDNTTTANNGTITISGLENGDAWSFDIEDENGCPINVSGTFVGTEEATLTYPQTSYCADAPNPSPIITGVTGGAYSSTAGLSINATTGVVNLGASTPDTYTISYQTPDPICFTVETFEITINPLPIVTVNSEDICLEETIELTAAGADTYTWTPATFLNATTGAIVETTPTGNITYTVTGTITATGCDNTAESTVVVNPLPVVTITGDAEYCISSTALLNAGPSFDSYLWSTGATTQTINATEADNPISVTVENEFQCFTESAPFTVTENSVITTSASFSICEGGSREIHGVNQTTSGVYSQTFTSVNGCDSTSNVTLTVQPYPTALVTGTTEVCLNVTEPVITFTGGNGTAPYTFTYTINSGALQTITSTGDIATITIPTNSVQNYTVNLINVEESSTLTCSQTIDETATVSVHPLPTATITGQNQYCEGETTTLDAGAGFDSYLWSTGETTQTISATVANNPITVTVENEFQCSTLSAPFTVTENPIFNTTSNEAICEGQSILIHGVSQTTSGVYSQTFTSLNGCDSTSNVTLTVYPLPTATITDPATVCLNSASPLITFTGSNGTAPYTFTYRINNDPIQTITSAANSSTATLSAPTNTVGATTYTLVSVMDSSPMTCEQTINDDVTITVLQLPTASASGGTDVCINGDEPVITFTGNDGQAPYTFTYSINSGASQTISSTGNTATISVPTNTVGSFVYTLIDVTQSGTPACSQTQTESQIVVVHDIPNINAGNDISTCEGQTVILTASSNPPDQTITYNWDNGVTNEVPFLVTNTTTYTVTGVDQFGCENQDYLVVTLIPTPTVDFTGTNLIGCSPLTSSFTNTSTGNLTNCVWTFSNGSSMTGCGTVSSTFVNPGCYDVTLTVSTPEGCSNTATQQNVVCVEPDPISDFVVLNPNMTILNTTAQFGNQSSGASSYIWSFGDFSPASTEESPSHIYPDEPGTYNVTLTAYSEAGCVDQISQIVIINDELIFYVPNAFTPDGDIFNEVFFPVFTSGFDPMTYTLLIFDRWGEIIFESNDTRYGWPGTYGGKIVQDGVYVWKIVFKRTEVDKREVYYGHVNVLR
jgi:gliding motility-associated-like protein